MLHTWYNRSCGRVRSVALLLIALLCVPLAASAQDTEWLRVLTLQDHNTRVVVLGTFLLGIAAGVVGSFTLLRKRALMGDALSHATLPGICLAFVFSVGMGYERSLFLLLFGAVVTGALGLGCVLLLRRHTRLKEDAALGVVLSVFFGAGICMLTIVQQLGSGSAAGLESFVYGKTASMVPHDVELIAIAGVLVLVLCTVLFKELRLLCFDPAYAAAQGWPTLALDVLLMGLVTVVTVVGLQAVGLILIIALLIIPAAAARFWSDKMLAMTLLAGLLGGISAAVGSGISALAPKLPSGAMIVLVAALVFALSMAFGPARGVVPRALQRARTRKKIGRQHLLRAIYEHLELETPADYTQAVSFATIKPARSWSDGELRKLASRAERAELLRTNGKELTLTEHGIHESERIVRNHRLWETYLINFADIAPSHVDRDADAVEHILGPKMVADLEQLVAEGTPHLSGNVLPSPHPIAPRG